MPAVPTVLPSRSAGLRILAFGEVIGFGVPPMPDFWIGPCAGGGAFRPGGLFTRAGAQAVERV